MPRSDDPHEFAGRSHGSGQCVALVRAASGAQHTSTWRKGEPVLGNRDLEPGTAIATFDGDRYGNHTDGRSHAAIFLGHVDGGIRVLDQWIERGRKRPAAERIIRDKAGSGQPVDDASCYAVIEDPAED